MILLVRHALAVPRGEWDGADQRRPLTRRGHRQAAGLVESVRPFAIDRIVASPTARCTATVAPLAEDRGLTIETSKFLREGRGDRALDLVLATPGDVLFCTHGDVVESVLRELRRTGWPIPARPKHAKGSAWVLSAAGPCQYVPPRAGAAAS